MMPATLVADSFVSVAAIAGLLILYFSMRKAERAEWINRRFGFVIQVLICLMATRVLYWVTDLSLFRILNMASAGLVPLSMLLLSEGLTRRHAPLVFKIFATAGSVVFVLGAPFEALYLNSSIMIGLLVFQVISIIAIGAWVVIRDRSELEAGENRIIDRLSWALLLIIPFAISDFRIGILDFPVRLSGVAILFLCWLSLSLNRVRVHHIQIVYSMLLFVVGSGVAIATIGIIAGLDWPQMVQSGAIILSTGLLLQVRAEAKAHVEDDERSSLMQYMARHEGADVKLFLQGLQEHRLVAHPLLLEEGDLGDFDASLRDHLRRTKIVTASRSMKGADGSVAEQVGWLLGKYNATHAIFAGDAPFRLVVLNLPSLTGEPDTDVELSVVQRLLELMSRVGKSDD